MEKQKLPGANSSLILGICSIVTACCCYGILGVILGIIGLNKAKKAQLTFEENPELYQPTGNAKAGKITSIIGLTLGGLYTLYLIYLLTSGDLMDQIDENQRLIEDLMNQ